MIRNSSILAAALFAAFDAGNTSAGAELPVSLRSPDGQPPVDNAFVAPGCERFGSGLDEALSPAEQSRVSAAMEIAQQQEQCKEPENSAQLAPERERLEAHVRMERDAQRERIENAQQSVQSPQRVPRPSIGRIVHYVPEHIRGNNPPSPLPAIVTRVFSETCVNLRVFHDDERVPEHVTSVEHASRVDPNGRFWFWPVTN